MMKNFYLIFGILLLANLVNATTTTSNVTVNNTLPVISTIFTYNLSGNTTLFDFEHNLTVKANITDGNDRDDISSILISITDYSNNIVLKNTSMNLTNITSGYTAEYNYTLNSTSKIGNYTVTIFTNDSTGNSITNSTTIKIQLIIQASVSAPSLPQGQPMDIYHNSTLVISSSTDSNGRIYVPYGYDWYWVYYHPKTGYSSWEYFKATKSYETVSITGTAGSGMGGGGGGGGAPAVTIEEEENITSFIFDLKFQSVWLANKFIHSNLLLKNLGDKAGDIILRYSIIQDNKIYNQKEEQVFVDNTDGTCSTVNCPYYSKIMLPYGCWADTSLRVEALELKESNTTKVIAKTEQMVCKAKKEAKEPEILIPQKFPTQQPPQQNIVIVVLFILMAVVGFVFLKK